MLYSCSHLHGPLSTVADLELLLLFLIAIRFHYTVLAEQLLAHAQYVQYRNRGGTKTRGKCT